MPFLLSARGKRAEHVGTSLHLQLQMSQDGNTEIIKVLFWTQQVWGVPSCHPHLL